MVFLVMLMMVILDDTAMVRQPLAVMLTDQGRASHAETKRLKVLLSTVEGCCTSS